MIVTAIVVPTPKRIKKRLRENIEKEDIFLYGLILAGMGIIGLSDTEVKMLPIIGLAYCGFSYGVLKRMDDETLEIILKDYNRFTKNYY